MVGGEQNDHCYGGKGLKLKGWALWTPPGGTLLNMGV